jgi:gliding motility-associated protein GldL
MSLKSTSNKNWAYKFYKVFMPKVYGIGAAIVIIGAMFKLLNWPGGAIMLGLGLTTEAIIFLLSAFEPQTEEVDWTRVYPELHPAYQGELPAARQGGSVEGLGEKLDELFAKAQIDQALIDRLGEGMHRLANSVAGITNLAQAGEATEQYITQITKASQVLGNIYEAHTNVLSAVSNLTAVSQDSQHYHEQIQQLAQVLTQVNVNYQEELQATHLRLEQSKQIFERISGLVGQLQEAGNESQHFKQELVALNEKITSLNSVYGNMLTALKS